MKSKHWLKHTYWLTYRLVVIGIILGIAIGYFIGSFMPFQEVFLGYTHGPEGVPAHTGMIPFRSPIMPKAIPNTNLITAKVTPIQNPVSSDTSASVPALALTSTITSPHNGEKFCYGDYVPIVWSAPKAVAYVNVLLLSKNKAMPIGEINGTKDASSAWYSYEYRWNEAYRSGLPDNSKFIDAGSAYQISIVVNMKDGSRQQATSAGFFSISDCHTGVTVAPPMK